MMAITTNSSTSVKARGFPFALPEYDRGERPLGAANSWVFLVTKYSFESKKVGVAASGHDANSCLTMRVWRC
jgi:hypothetical protein